MDMIDSPFDQTHSASFGVQTPAKQETSRQRIAREKRICKTVASDLVIAFREQAKLATETPAIHRIRLKILPFMTSRETHRHTSTNNPGMIYKQKHAAKRIYTNIQDPRFPQIKNRIRIVCHYDGSISWGSSAQGFSVIPAGDQAIPQTIAAVSEKAEYWAGHKVVPIGRTASRRGPVKRLVRQVQKLFF